MSCWVVILLFHCFLFFVCVLWAHRVCPLLHLPKASRDDLQDEKQPQTLHVVTVVPKEASILIKASNQTGSDGLAASSIGLQLKAKCSLAFARQKSAALRCAKSLRHYSRTLCRGQRGTSRQQRCQWIGWRWCSALVSSSEWVSKLTVGWMWKFRERTSSNSAEQPPVQTVERALCDKLCKKC